MPAKIYTSTPPKSRAQPSRRSALRIAEGSFRASPCGRRFHFYKPVSMNRVWKSALLWVPKRKEIRRTVPAVMPVTSLCAHCDQRFEMRRADARFCCNACRQAAYRARA